MIPDWHQHARCAETDPELWFPEAGESGKADQARKICRSCPVRLPCLEQGLLNKEYGIWGGLTRRERSDLLGTRSNVA